MNGSGKVRRQNVGFALQNVCLNLKILQHSECQVTLSFTCAKPLSLLQVFLTQNIAKLKPPSHKNRTKIGAGSREEEPYGIFGQN